MCWSYDEWPIIIIIIIIQEKINVAFSPKWTSRTRCVELTNIKNDLTVFFHVRVGVQ